MQIGLIGWYGKSNAGDERILYCIQRFFASDEIVITTAWQNAWERIDELNRCDFVLIGGGGLVLRGVNRWTKLLTALKPPFGCIGISVETQHPDAQEFINILKARARFILVRDKQSATYLDENSKVIIGPDLTFLYPYDITSQVKEEVLALNLRPWHYWRSELDSTGYAWMQRLNELFPTAEKFYPLPKWKPVRVINQLAQHFDSIIPVPLDTKPGTTGDVTLLQAYFKDVSDTFRPDRLAASRYLIGMRLHSLIFACQMGIPFLSLSYMPKNHQFCTSLGLEEFSLSLYKLSLFPKALANLQVKSEELREKLVEIRDLNHVTIHQIMTHIQRLMIK